MGRSFRGVLCFFFLSWSADFKIMYYENGLRWFGFGVQSLESLSLTPALLFCGHACVGEPVFVNRFLQDRYRMFT